MDFDPVRKKTVAVGKRFRSRPVHEVVEHALRDAMAEVERLRDRLQAENAYLQAEVRNEGRFDSIVGDSAALTAVLDQIDQVAPTNSSVLIIGESGTGKEMLARVIHRLSNRSTAPFYAVNMASFSKTIFEDEFFGHAKGAFTGAASLVTRDVPDGETVLGVPARIRPRQPKPEKSAAAEGDIPAKGTDGIRSEDAPDR